jgi:hypothetical protein
MKLTTALHNFSHTAEQASCPNFNQEAGIRDSPVGGRKTHLKTAICAYDLSACRKTDARWASVTNLLSSLSFPQGVTLQMSCCLTKEPFSHKIQISSHKQQIPDFRQGRELRVSWGSKV